ncbi:unnamed protein product [Calypogeia fissa]
MSIQRQQPKAFANGDICLPEKLLSVRRPERLSDQSLVVVGWPKIEIQNIQNHAPGYAGWTDVLCASSIHLFIEVDT